MFSLKLFFTTSWTNYLTSSSTTPLGLFINLVSTPKKEVIPKQYLAIVGDSNTYGFGPWLYDNSWSMEQPSFAVHHLLHASLKKDVVSFGYPGFGSLGASLSMVSELQMLKNSWLWPKIDNPLEILFVFYEGNDLINNLHEVEQRGLDLHTIESNTLDQKIV